MSASTAGTLAGSCNLSETQTVALSASTASLLSKSILHPLDTIKCRVQCYSVVHGSLGGNSRGAASPLTSWQRAVAVMRGVRAKHAGVWGPRYLYSGLPVKLAFYMPYQAVYMSTYNAARTSLGVERHLKEEGRDLSFLSRTAAAAVAAELGSCGVRVPMEALKMRIQTSAARNTADAVRQLRRHGLLACARLAVPQTLVHDIPYSVAQWITYESMQPWRQAAMHVEGPQVACPGWGVEALGRTFFSGGCSGLIASTITIPLDNIRTRVVVATAAAPSLTVGQVVRRAYRDNGWRGFVQGGGMRVLWVSTNMALYFPLLEMCRAALTAPSKPSSRILNDGGTVGEGGRSVGRDTHRVREKSAAL